MGIFRYIKLKVELMFCPDRFEVHHEKKEEKKSE